VSEARFAAGTRVQVLDLPVAGHMRTPHFVRGRQGIIERCHGRFPNPETRAYGKDGQPAKPLYMIRFRQKDLWPNYQGDGADSILVDIFEQWLEPASGSRTREAGHGT
jgi:nitrile hydratase subunit beta